jgi:dihydroneopterin aldolase
VIVELEGVEAVGRHGVNDDERREAQTFLFDVAVEIDEPREDSIDATVDYRALRDAIATLCENESYRLLETLAAAIADAIAASFPVRAVRVRVRKPGIAWADWSAVTVERP